MIAEAEARCLAIAGDCARLLSPVRGLPHTAAPPVTEPRSGVRTIERRACRLRTPWVAPALALGIDRDRLIAACRSTPTPVTAPACLLCSATGSAAGLQSVGRPRPTAVLPHCEDSTVSAGAVPHRCFPAAAVRLQECGTLGAELALGGRRSASARPGEGGATRLPPGITARGRLLRQRRRPPATCSQSLAKPSALASLSPWTLQDDGSPSRRSGS